MSLGQKQSFPGRCVGLHVNVAYSICYSHLDKALVKHLVRCTTLTSLLCVCVWVWVGRGGGVNVQSSWENFVEFCRTGFTRKRTSPDRNENRSLRMDSRSQDLKMRDLGKEVVCQQVLHAVVGLRCCTAL